MAAPLTHADAEPLLLDDRELDAFLDALYRDFQHDFRLYARSTLRRRLGQALPALGCGDLPELLALVRRDRGALPRLIGYLTVQVGDLFRDPDYWLALREQAVPLLRTYPSLKVWIAGCGDGEEVYSLAILLEEEGLLERTLIYATNVNATALRCAEAGVYALDRAQGFTRNYQQAGGKRSLADYTLAAYERVVFDRRLRRNVVFSDHSLATDHVFAEVHLVSCRNVLIYFQDPLRERALRLFRDSLVRRGFLGLGRRESLRGCLGARSFVPLDLTRRLFVRH